MVVFDLGNLMSLMHCQQWLNEASRSNVGPHHIFLVGAKKDLLVSILAISYYHHGRLYNFFQEKAEYKHT